METQTNKKKIISVGVLVIGIVSVIIVVSLILNRKGPSIIVRKPLNEKVNLEEVLKNVEETDSDVENEDIAKGVDEIDFNEYNVLEKKALVYTTDENVNEIWMIKLGSYNQQEDVCRMLGQRVRKLKSAFENNEAQLKILNEAIIKQEEGIVIMIISPDAKEIEEKIAKAMQI